jgi:ferredoxin-fold anticodon binding domain-containing protein
MKTSMTVEEVLSYNEAHATPRKYRNVKATIDGIVFDSKAEARRWGELTLMQRAGDISDLKRQVPFVLSPAVKLGTRMKPALKLIVDFQYFDEHAGKTILEDTKGVVTEAFRIKLHLLKDKYGMEVRLTK